MEDVFDPDNEVIDNLPPSVNTTTFPLYLLRAWIFYNFIHCISYMYGIALNGLQQFPFSLKV